MSATERIRKHRAKLRDEQCSRLEVWIGTWIVEGIRQLAKRKGRETWSEVQDVLERHLVASGVGPSTQSTDSEHPVTGNAAVPVEDIDKPFEVANRATVEPYGTLGVISGSVSLFLPVSSHGRY
jgi:hypothetical protein